ncbi:MAG: outer membrane beta-barrel protein [Bacteroidia bacterium]
MNRKKSIFFLVLFLFTAFASAQTYSTSESSRFSFTGGMTSSKLLHDTVSYKPGISFGGGFRYSIVLSEKLNVGLEALYTGKSFKLESPIIKYRYFYIDVPVYLQYKLGENIRFNLGGQVSTFTNSKIVLIDGSNPSGINVKDYHSIKWTDYSVLAGMEFDLSDDIALGLRYNVSTSTFFQHDQPNFSVFELSLNYVVYRSHRQFGKSK